ncbi:MAG: hypothetical protein K6D94_02715 [Clostridiales bacterium]|nr:hypothetical protein [Clostridiales bacterium]
MKIKSGFIISALMILAITALYGCKSSDYKTATGLMSEGQYSEALELFNTLGDYKDVSDLITECENELAYAAAVELFSKGDYENAYDAFTALASFRDSSSKAAEAKRELDYADAVELMENGDFSGARDIFVSLNDFRNSSELVVECENELAYASAADLFEKGDYENAYAAFTALASFRDSADKAAAAKCEIDYAAAVKLYESGDYENAYTAFTELGSFRDAADKAGDAKREIDYADAVKLMEKGDFAGALDLFNGTKGLYDTTDRIKVCRSEIDYAEAVRLMDGGDYSGAHKLFAALGDFRDAAEKDKTCSNEIVYAEAKKLMNNGNYSAAYDKFASLCKTVKKERLYKDVHPEEYEEYLELLRELDYSDAEIKEELDLMFGDMTVTEETLVGYRDSGELASKCKTEMTYADATAAYGKKDYKTAYPLFSSLGDFRDSKAKAAECYDLTVGAEQRAKVLGDGDITERYESILQLKHTDPATAAKGAYKLIGEFNGAEQKWQIGHGIYIEDLLELCDAQGYTDCYDVFSRRVLATIKYDPNRYYAPGEDTVINTAASSKLMIEKLLPALVKCGWLNGSSSAGNLDYENKMSVLSQICGQYITHNGNDKLSLLLTARTLVSTLYKELTNYSYYQRPRFAPLEHEVYALKTEYNGAVPNFAGSASVKSTAGKYMIISRDMNYNGSTTPLNWKIDYGMMFALEPDNIPSNTAGADFIVTVENTWSKGHILYSGEKSLQAYDVTSVIKLYTADGRLVANLGSASTDTTGAMASGTASSYYADPDRAAAAKLLLQNWFGIKN